jgi:hypothetical protein
MRVFLGMEVCSSECKIYDSKSFPGKTFSQHFSMEFLLGIEIEFEGVENVQET